MKKERLLELSSMGRDELLDTIDELENQRAELLRGVRASCETLHRELHGGDFATCTHVACDTVYRLLLDLEGAD